MNKVKELADQFGKSEAEVKEIIRPMLNELLQFCQSDGGDEALAKFRASKGGRQFLQAMKENEEKDLTCSRCRRVWKWPEDMERPGLCVWCAADLYCAQHRLDEAVEDVGRKSNRSRGRQ